ncbi:MAG: hypothetical protein JWR02_1688 [Mucilaginibacter sp.]|nr:hypothetical protein [Mucilaginibacter sp.]
MQIKQTNYYLKSNACAAVKGSLLFAYTAHGLSRGASTEALEVPVSASIRFMEVNIVL